ncbi:metal-dependent hydrolase [Thalassoglobus sp. JC818]|uniref:metal-dependent hydrolase n=1 Tax=Thalassoglobus sp. JC818 TaxID=3232136 RepID=UPI00345AFF22
MKTPSHFLMTAAIGKIPGLKVIPSAILLGSIAPDLPLYFLTLGSFLWMRNVVGWEPREIFRTVFDHWFFENPVWIVLHNFLHAPLILLSALACIAIRNPSLPKLQSSWWFWFFLSCLFHSVIDIFTHFDDGPLIWFPFDWSTRFASPVSYWDSRHFGREFSQFELWLDLGLLLFLAYMFWKQSRQKQSEVREQNA